MARAGELDDTLQLLGLEPDLIVGVAPRDMDPAHHDGAHRAAAPRASDRSGSRAASRHDLADHIVGDVGREQAKPSLDLAGGELHPAALRAAPDVAPLPAHELDVAARAYRRAIAIGHGVQDDTGAGGG